jgi:deoxycytidine triphosphate deaminase/addiction module HigA family antidote
MTGVSMPRSKPAEMTPGAYLRAEIKRLGLDQVAVSKATEVSRQTINNIVNGRQDISRAMATKLARLTNRTPDFWLRSRFPAAEELPDSAIADQRGEASDHRHDHAPSILVNHQIARAVSEGILIIRPFRDEHVRFASIDLTLADFVIVASGRMIDISDQGFTLRRGENICVSTKELLEFPLDHVGRLGAVARLAKCGIVTSHGMHVDPGFSGNLQFCMFNAGADPFELRGGEPIVSLEITRLASIPSQNTNASVHGQAAANRDDITYRSGEPSDGSRDGLNLAIRQYLRAQVETAPAGAEVVARIPALDIEMFDHPKQIAIEGAVDFALGTLSDIQVNAELATELIDRYRTFFDRAASDLHISAEQIRRALELLATIDAGATGPGANRHFRLPRGTAKISLRNLAGQLNLEAVDLILMLTGRHVPRP